MLITVTVEHHEGISMTFGYWSKRENYNEIKRN